MSIANIQMYQDNHTKNGINSGFYIPKPERSELYEVKLT
jgi:hypothetical protein